MHDPGTPPDARQHLIDALHRRFHEEPWILAAWLGGSDATGRTDRWSDIDLVVIVEDDRVEETFELAARAAAEVAPITRVNRRPQPTWHGHDQSFFQFEGVPDWCMLDLVVMTRSSTAPRFLEPERHGRATVLFDREQLTRPGVLDEPAHTARMRERLESTVVQYRMFQHLVRKAAWRNDAPEAADRYLTYTIRPLVEVLRMRHCPERFDFGMRYLRDDLPEPLFREIESLSLPGDLDELLEMQERAEALFERTLTELRRDPPAADP